MNIIFLLIIFFAAALRLLKLGQLPPGLYLDEVLYGLDAYSILKTGKDIYSHFLPLAFQSSGYYPPLFTYILAPFFLIFPLSAFTVRFPVALTGIAAVIAIYFLTQALIKPQKKSLAPLLASFFLAFSPWHIHLSRVAFLASFGLIFLILGTYFFLRQQIILSLLVFSLSTQVHYGYKLISPVLFLSLLLLQRKSIKRSASLLLPAGFIVGLTLASHFVGARYFNALFRVNQLSLAAPHQIISQYLVSFSPDFLFFRGDDYLLLNPWQRGQLSWLLIPFILIGIYHLRRLPRQSRWLLFIWLLITPLPSVLAGQGKHAVRHSPLLIPLLIIAALGADSLFRQSKFLSLSLIFFITIHSLAFLRFYTQDYPRLSAPLWGQNQRRFINQLPPRSNNAPLITVPDKFYVNLAFYAFQTKLDPSLLQQAIISRRLDNLYFTDQLNQ